MRIVTKLLTSLAIITLLSAASISLIIIQNPFSDEIPENNLDHKQKNSPENNNTTQQDNDDGDITDLRFYGNWKISDKNTALNITIDRTYSTDSIKLNWDVKDSPTDDEDDGTPSSGSDDENSAPISDITIIQGDYTIDDEKKRITLKENGQNYTYNFSFSNDNDTLTLTDIQNSQTYVYQRQIHNVNSSEDLNKYLYQKVKATGVLNDKITPNWYNLTLSDQTNVPINVSNINYDFTELQGSLVSFYGNVLTAEINYSKEVPYYNRNCSCYLANINSDSFSTILE